jgi:hypothetical protein
VNLIVVEEHTDDLYEEEYNELSRVLLNLIAGVGGPQSKESGSAFLTGG